ncbi:MAG TPA: hypothetical protein VF746_00060 [Longimicrobium sp.]|jgi:hypothetical protein
MRKLRLDLEQLHVETFDTGPEDPDGRGTVEAYKVRAVTYGTCWQSCSPEDTCPDNCSQSCPGVTCAETCPYSCDTTCGSGGTDTGTDTVTVVDAGG